MGDLGTMADVAGHHGQIRRLEGELAACQEEVAAAYGAGRADERRDVVAYLRGDVGISVLSRHSVPWLAGQVAALVHHPGSVAAGVVP